MTREIFSEEQFVVTARTHTSRALVAEVCLLLKEHASEADLRRGLAVAHVCRHLLHQEQHALGSQAVVSLHATRNLLQSKVATTKDRLNNMTFRDGLVAQALAEVNRKGST